VSACEPFVQPGDIILSAEMHSIVTSETVVKDVSGAKDGSKLLLSMSGAGRQREPSLDRGEGGLATLRREGSQLSVSADEMGGAKQVRRERSCEAHPSFARSIHPLTLLPIPQVRLSHDKQAILELFNEPSLVEKLSGSAGSWSRLEHSTSSLRSRVSRHDMSTIMFVNISSEKLKSSDPQTALDGLNNAFTSFYGPTKLFGGTLRQFLTDDKGTVAIIVFSGRESNTVSACRCALKIKVSGGQRTEQPVFAPAPNSLPPPPNRRTSRTTTSLQPSASPPARCSSVPWATSDAARWRGSGTR
jgi:hypothetical protein